ncbi:trypsin-like peptidase domain-containing protein [Fulvivirga sp. M361]|uniref:S1 family peptidase n=1 Tax=Fulvivirga sp. M361 TaxID=2594266 RepID=UPI00117AEBDB|nr:serine protease [Fulvivirga sp. M361]TRX58757.1 trypsin-like peptidase domain-containing protein [Fulvivirga sp. M361]
MASQNTVSKEDAKTFLTREGDRLMENLNWDYASVVREEDADDYSLSVGVYDLDKEKENPKGLNDQIYDLEVMEDYIAYKLPLQGSTKKNLEHDLRLLKVLIKTLSSDDQSHIYEADENCSVFSPRMMGHKLYDGIDRTKYGSFGAVLIGEDDDTRYVITAYHVIKKGVERSNERAAVYSPTRLEYKLGHFYWHEYDEFSDIALIEVDDAKKVSKGSICCCEIGKNIGPLPAPGDKVKICSPHTHRGAIKTGTVKSDCSTKRITPGQTPLLKNLIQTSDMAAPGDSGSVVFNLKNEPVGLLIKDKGNVHSYFMSLDIFKKRIRKDYNTHKVNFKFQKFI